MKSGSVSPSTLFFLFKIGLLILNLFHLYVNFRISLLISTLKILYFLKILFIYFERKGKEERERNNVWLPLVCLLLGTWPTTQACALIGNRTSDPLLHSLVLNPLRHTSQGLIHILTEITLFLYTVWGTDILTTLCCLIHDHDRPLLIFSSYTSLSNVLRFSVKRFYIYLSNLLLSIYIFGKRKWNF